MKERGEKKFQKNQHSFNYQERYTPFTTNIETILTKDLKTKRK